MHSCSYIGSCFFFWGGGSFSFKHVVVECHLGFLSHESKGFDGADDVASRCEPWVGWLDG